MKNHSIQYPIPYLLIEKLKQALLSQKLDSSLERELKSFGFSDPSGVFRNLLSLFENPVARQDFLEILEYLVLLLQKSPAPDLSLNHFERFCVNAFSSSHLYAFLKNAPRTFELLIHLFGTSPALAEVLIRNPEYFDWLCDPLVLEKSWTQESFHNEIDAVLEQAQYSSSTLNTLRRFKRRQMLRIGARDMLGLSPLEETTRDISYLADVCLDWAYRWAYRELEKKFGEPRRESASWEASRFAVIGMGKLGGLELNYSSDIDVMFVYDSEGVTSGGSEISIDNHRFFTRLAQRMLQILGTMTREGSLYRVDARLRPEGATGPLVRSLESFENYYATWGRAWERQALIKARVVAGNQDLGDQFLQCMIPFIYRRYMDYQAIEEMKGIKDRIDQEVTRRGENERNVKLGTGGIREIEFGIQILQLLYGGKIKTLREGNSLGAILKLEKEGLLNPDVSSELRLAYVFLRRVEHLLQLEYERQTHILPEEPQRLELLARRLGYESSKNFFKDYQTHTHQVRAFYQNVFSDLMSAQPREEGGNLFANLFEKGEASSEEKKLLQSLGFADVEGAARNLLSLARGQDYTHISAETLHGFTRFLPVFLEALKKSFDPDQSLMGLERFVSSYKTRGGLFETLQASKKMTELLVMLFGISPFLSSILMRNPDFFDLISEGVLEERHEDEADIRGRSNLFERSEDFEKRLLLLREYRDIEVLKQGLRDILGLDPPMRVIEGLSRLAEKIIHDAFEMAKSFFETKYHRPSPSLAVMGLGKLGGRELNYASDLDLLFVGPEDTEELGASYGLANIFMDVLGRSTAEGFLYRVDTRLRPDGIKGPLVPSLGACRAYYGASPSIWERMAFTRARWIEGDESLGSQASEIFSEFVFRKPPTEDEICEIKNLRERIFHERCGDTPAGFDVKSGIGGLLDIEFLAQFLQLKWGKEKRELRETHTLKLLQRLASAKALPQGEVGLLVEAYLFYRDVESTLRLVKDRATDFIPHESGWASKIQRKMNLAFDAEKFFEKLDHFSRVVRYIYQKYLI